MKQKPGLIKLLCMNLIFCQCFGSVNSYSFQDVTQENKTVTQDSNPKLTEAKKLMKMSESLHKEGKYKEAIPLLEQVVKLRESVLGSEDVDTASAYFNLAILYRLIADYEKAETHLLKAIAIQEKILGSEHRIIARSYDALANLYQSIKAPGEKAEPLYLKALAIREKVLGTEHPETATSYHNLGTFYSTKGNYEKAESFLKKAILIREKVLGESNDTNTSIQNLALVYREKGEYSKAKPLFEKALSIQKKISGNEHPNIALILTNLSSLHKDIGEYDEAENFDKEAIAIYSKRLGEQHPRTLSCTANLAGLYADKGEYDKAEALLQKVIPIQEKTLGVHRDTASSLNSLALLYRAKGEYDKAEPLLEKSLAMRKQYFGIEHQSTAQSLNNLALLYHDKGNYDKAEPVYQQALEIREKILGANHPSVASTLYNLGSLYYDKGEYNKAEPLLQRAASIRENVLGLESPYTSDSFNGLSLFYQAKGELEKAVNYKIKANEVRERELERNLLIGSESQKLTYLNLTAKEKDSTLSLHLNSSPKNQEATKMALTMILRRKGRALDAMTNVISIARKRANEKDLLLLDELSSKQTQLSELTLRGKEKDKEENHQVRIKQLVEETEQLQNQIAASVIGFKANVIKITLEGVQQAIPSNAALVEFSSYRPHNAKTNSYGELRYAAYVLTNKGIIGFVDLGKAQTIDDATKEFREVLVRKSGKPISDVEKEVKPKARTIDRLVMEPVRKLLSNQTHLLISPDGQLNLVPFDAFVNQQGEYLVEEYDITYLTSGRDLLRLQDRFGSNEPAAVVTEPDFGEGKGPVLIGKQYDRLRRLSGATEEAKTIEELFSHPKIYFGKSATKKAVKEINQPKFLHIITHGYFLSDAPTENVGVSSNQRSLLKTSDEPQLSAINIREFRLTNPLLRSGLFFAGANNTEDGVMTSLEATSLNLLGTKLVTLSACETGLGDVKNGEGTYGLRRSLVLAGAETQVISLWSVDGIATKKIMVKYYDLLQKGEERGKAMRKAELSLLKGDCNENQPKGKLNKQNLVFSHPYYWASFIQSGDWRKLE